MADKEKNINGSEAKASTPKHEKKENKIENKDEWLESEINEVNLDDEKNSKKDGDVDALMKQAAEKIENLKNDVKEWKDNYLRLHAEWDTYRRRTAEQREAEKATAAESLVKDILPVLDDFERSIDFAQKNGEAGLLDGVKAIHSKLVSMLVKNGTEVIDPQSGDAFDALEHQAVTTVENPEYFDESISSVMQKGYKMGKKVIRPAMVGVTTGGKKRPAEVSDVEEDSKN